jgi:hypothetical protein
MNVLISNLAAAILVACAVGLSPCGACHDGDLFLLIGAFAFVAFVAAWSQTPRARHRRVRS